MPKQKVVYRYRTKKTSHRSNKMTAVKGMKLLIALGPPVARAAQVATAVGGGLTTKQGALTFLNVLAREYSGLDFQNNAFMASELLWGYAPIAGAWAFGKFAAPHLRI